MIHLVRSNFNEDAENDVITRDDFDKRLKILKSKNKDKYEFIMKSGKGMKNCLFELFCKVWATERKPEQWRDTIIIQLWKGKSDAANFDNQRNIHTKNYVPKYFEGIVVDKSKDKMVKSCSKFQIGGMPGHRPQEHLFTAKSVISLYNMLNIPLFLQIYDISKYFDKEILRNAMDTLYSAGITGKLYRLWFMLNRDSQIRVKTSFGMTDRAATGENVTQGSIGGALLSALNLSKTLSAYFGGSNSEISYGSTQLSPLQFQDDCARFSSSIEEAQKGNILMSKAMKAMQLDLNIDKSATILFGRKKHIMKMRKSIEENRSLSLNGKQVEIKLEEKYLGDYLHSYGLSKSVEVTVNKRYGKCIKSVIELKSVINDFRMYSLGGISVGLDIFTMAILPVMMTNSATWTMIDQKTIEKLDNFQHILQRCLLGASNSTPLVALSWDLGMLSMEHNINQTKLIFLQFLISQDNENLSKEVYNIQKSLNFPGFIPEARNLISKYNLPNIIDQEVHFSKLKWKSIVKKAINTNYENELKSKMTTSKLKDGPMTKESFGKKEYLMKMQPADARTNFRLRSKTFKAIMNMKSDRHYAANLWKCAQCGNLDTQSHIMWCPSLAPLREGLDVSNDTDVIHYFQEVFKIRERLEGNQSD